MEEPNQLLASGVHARLNEQSRRDWDAGCRCLAFENATAAAFHCLRCIEECVRTLYRAYFPGNKISHETWGQLTTQLRQKPRRPKPDDVLLVHLDHLRISFRNPTDHPEKSYDVEESEDLIHLAADSVNRCLRDPKVRERG